MINAETVDFLKRIKSRLEFLYGDEADQCLRRLQMLMGRYGVAPEPGVKAPAWTEKDAILITYGDSVKEDREYPLFTLNNFIRTRIGQAITGVHVLPFFPYSSDDGFSVIDYRRVREDLGGWWHIEEIAKDYRVMADLVINHVSQHSEWFSDFKKDIAPFSEYFIEADKDTDISNVTRPRTTPLLTKVDTAQGEKHVWTTFSPDQVDVNFKNPDVLFEYLDIILFYISKGVDVIRLDAIAYLWKKLGTSCIHLEETHEMVKLIRDFLDVVAPHVTIITETNVPHKENVSYFGRGDEAHMIYQFSLPPLLLYTLLFQNAEYLTLWAKNLKSPDGNCYYFNFLASHDGIGVRPLEGLVPDEDFDALVESIPKHGGMVSKKTNPDGSESPYELNITYFSALGDSNMVKQKFQVSRFLCAHTIMFTLQGIPGIYIHSMVATTNDKDGVKLKGHKRAINRRQWNYEELQGLLDDPESENSKVFTRLKQILDIRSQQPAFHPEATQKIYSVDTCFFVVIRRANDNSQTILSVSNVTNKIQTLAKESFSLPINKDTEYENLLGDNIQPGPDPIELGPFETVWLVV